MQKKQKTENKELCRECENLSEQYSPAIDGHMLLGRCPYRKHAVLLSSDVCTVGKYRKRTE